nr:hypothetical protein L203_03440 [Cryptococcus depauperatus CBS 7841]
MGSPSLSSRQYDAHVNCIVARRDTGSAWSFINFNEKIHSPFQSMSQRLDQVRKMKNHPSVLDLRLYSHPAFITMLLSRFSNTTTLSKIRHLLLVLNFCREAKYTKIPSLCLRILAEMPAPITSKQIHTKISNAVYQHQSSNSTNRHTIQSAFPANNYHNHPISSTPPHSFFPDIPY